jgi:hemolysin activation/secretion protein
MLHFHRAVRHALTSALVALPGLAFAQAFDRIAPREPPAAPAPAVAAPAETPAPPASNAVVLAELRGLVFLPAMTDLRANGVPAGATAIASDGVPLLNDSAFTAQIAPFIGRKLTFADLTEITRLTTAWFRARGRPFVAVAVPPQNIGSGVVQIVASEYRLGSVTVAGNEWFSSALLQRQSGLVPGQTLTMDGLRDDLEWLNGNAFRGVTTEFQPGNAAGTTDVVLRTKYRLPFRGYAGFDKAGVPSLGRGEWNVVGNWGNAFGADQTLSYQYTRALSGRYDAHAVSWSVPLPWRDTLLMFGSFANEAPNTGSVFSEKGTSGQASFRYTHPLPRLGFGPAMELTHSVQVGYDYKTSNNNLEFGGTQVFASNAAISQFPLVYDAHLTDKYDQTALQNQFVVSPGGMMGANNTAAFQAVVAGASADYVYDRVALTRITSLPVGQSRNVFWTTRAVAQVASRNLLYSEQLGAGGIESVRGYFTDTALGSQGFLVSQEIRSPAFGLAQLLHIGKETSDSDQIGVFWDYGHVSQVRPVPGVTSQADLSSVGVDLHVTVDRYVDIKFDVGWQLRNVPGTARRGAFGDIAVVVGF